MRDLLKDRRNREHTAYRYFLLTTPTWEKPADGDTYVVETLTSSLSALLTPEVACASVNRHSKTKGSPSASME